MPSAAPAAAPASVPGSIRYFVLLYTPASQRGSLARLLALGDELGSGLDRHLEHALAHTRLDWWRGEIELYAAGAARHPLLRGLHDPAPGALPAAAPALAALELQQLVAAAALDLAQGLMQPNVGEGLQGALFIAAASLLGAADISPPQREAVVELGTLTRQYERGEPTAAAEAQLRLVVTALGPLLQRPAAPLLVWTTLALARARRRRRAGAKTSRQKARRSGTAWPTICSPGGLRGRQRKEYGNPDE